MSVPAGPLFRDEDAPSADRPFPPGVPARPRPGQGKTGTKTGFRLCVESDLELRLLDEQDVAELFALTDRNRSHLREWLPWLDSNSSVADTRSFIHASLQQFADRRSLAAGIWFQSELAGVIGLHAIDWNNRSVAIGYWIGASFQGRGLVTRSCRALVEYVFAELGLNRVEISCAVENRRSRRVPERLGFSDEGLTRQTEWLYDHFVDHAVYRMLRSDWRLLRDQSHR